MIKLVDVTADCFDSLNFEIKAGTVCKIIGNSNTELKTLIDIILYIKKPLSGKVFLLNNDLYALPKTSAIKLLSRVGVVWRYGGLISNLKVWENITLPKYYYGVKKDNLEEKIIDICRQIGIDEDCLLDLMGKMPAHLTIFEKKISGFIRAMLTDPDIILYDTVFTGVESDMIAKLTEIMIKFHLEKPDRISIFFSDEHETLKNIEGRTIKLKKILTEY
ncbi:MAG: ATP-binding cassette domain-containing protein [Nitrospirae bacterium]|nr:ATP-binding cassette domain-containing protein [Nitrospirota bacterium]MBF0540919.1 ATP-binding cassette domain-containing protein [Nitrospirota bacterium]